MFRALGIAFVSFTEESTPPLPAVEILFEHCKVSYNKDRDIPGYCAEIGHSTFVSARLCAPKWLRTQMLTRN
jgi:hypothetical protein